MLLILFKHNFSPLQNCFYFRVSAAEHNIIIICDLHTVPVRSSHVKTGQNLEKVTGSIFT